MLLFPIGEAANPGPRISRGSEFCIGCCNTSGLVGKAHLFDQQMHTGDVWYATETHLTQMGMTQFRAGLRQVGSKFKYCVGGSPVPHRSSKSISGLWRGVGVISKFPSRAMPHQWPDVVHQSCRVGAFATLVNDLWIQAGVMYGVCEGPQHPNYLAHNEELLKAVVTQVAYVW